MVTMEEIGIEVNKDGIHVGKPLVDQLRQLSDDDVLALSNERNPRNHNRYTSLAKRCQKIWIERRSGKPNLLGAKSNYRCSSREFIF